MVYKISGVAHLEAYPPVTAQVSWGRNRIVVSIPACHAGGRGSIPRFGETFCFSPTLLQR